MKNTVSAGGVVVNNGRAVLVLQRGRSWSLPKGHVEYGESELNAAKREIFEETGIPAEHLELVEKLGDYSRKGSRGKEFKHIHVFLFKTTVEPLQPQDSKITEAFWIPLNEVAKRLTAEADKAFFSSVAESVKSKT